jgi:hypothetical protein
VDRRREAAQVLGQSYGRVEAGKQRDVIEAKTAMSRGRKFTAHHPADALAEQQAQSVTVQVAEALVNEAEANLCRAAKEHASEYIEILIEERARASAAAEAALSAFREAALAIENATIRMEWVERFAESRPVKLAQSNGYALTRRSRRCADCWSRQLSRRPRRSA